MAYTKQQWIDNQTPLDASHMNHIEEGIELVSNNLTNVETTIDELNASAIDYSNTTSGLQAIDVQSAVDELDGKIDKIGYTYSVGFSSKTLKNATYENMATLTGLPKGTYLVMTIFNFNSNQTGARRTVTYANSTTVPNYSRYNGATTSPTVVGVTLLQYTRVLTLNEDTNTIGLAGYQSSGSDMTGCAGMIYATRIA